MKRAPKEYAVARLSHVAGADVSIVVGEARYTDPAQAAKVASAIDQRLQPAVVPFDHAAERRTRFLDEQRAERGRQAWLE
jgi:hypothetical protein